MIENIIPILKVESLQASLSYYQEVLGFSATFAGDSFAGLERDNWRIYLAEGEQGQAGMWLWIGLHDVDAMFEECRSKGAKLRGEIINNPWAREFHVEDPDGHVLRFGGEPAAE